MTITLSGITALSKTSVGGEYPAQAFTWAFDQGTTIAFSQANTVRFDQTVVTGVTQIGISNVDGTGTNRFTTIQSWHNQANSAGTSYLTVGSTVFQITSADFVTWNFRFMVSYYSGSTTRPAQGELVTISFSTSPPVTPFTYYRGTTAYTTGYSLTGFATVNDALITTPVKWSGSNSLDRGTYVDSTTRRFIDFPIDSINSVFWAEMWHYVPSAHTALDQSVSCFSLYNSSTAAEVAFWISYLGSNPTGLNFSRSSKNGLGVGGASGSSHVVLGGQRDVWHHLAWYVNDASWTLYIDGVRFSLGSLSHIDNGHTYDRVTLGDSKSVTDAQRRFYMDDFRLTAGSTRYSTGSATLTMPNQLAADASTTLLVNF